MFSQILDLADKLDIIQTVKAKLLRQPDPAADKLVAVLGELSKIYGACEAELRRYLSLSFDPAAGLGEERDVLLTLERSASSAGERGPRTLPQDLEHLPALPRTLVSQRSGAGRGERDAEPV